MGFIDYLKELFDPRGQDYYDYYEYCEAQRRQRERERANPITDQPKTVTKQEQSVNLDKDKMKEQIPKMNQSSMESQQPYSHKEHFYGDVYGPMPLEQDLTGRHYPREPFRKYYRKQKKDIIVFVIENSLYTRCYAQNIQAIVKRIIDSNKSAFFMMLKVGDGKRFFETSDYDTLTKDNVVASLFNESQQGNVDYIEVLDHITKFYKDTIVDYEYKSTKYDIQNISVVVIGSGKTYIDSEATENISKFVADIKNNKKTKTIKYFCMTDRQSIDVAKLGFPVIGHIDNDFYS